MGDRPLNVMVMGEIGVGKSSVINLIVGKDVAKVSPDAPVCTARTTKYNATVGSTHFNLWEMMGFNQPESSNDMQVIEAGLVSAFTSGAAVDVTLFCMRGKKVTKATLMIFRLIREMFEAAHVPVVIVVTNLEQEPGAMEDWWKRNELSLRRQGVTGAGHVCITALRDQSRDGTKSAESRRAMLDTLEAFHSLQTESISLESLFVQYVRRVEPNIARGWRVERSLMRRFGLDAATARRLATLL